MSSWQGKIDWTAVKKSGIQFAFAKATEGATYRDPTFKYNLQQMRAIGLELIGAYHFFRGLPNDSTAAQQAENIDTTLRNAAFDRNTNLLAIDVEEHGNNAFDKNVITNRLADLLSILHAKV